MNEGKALAGWLAQAAWYALLNLSWLNLHFTSLKIYLAVNNNGNLIQKVNNYDDLKNLFGMTKVVKFSQSATKLVTERKFFFISFAE